MADDLTPNSCPTCAAGFLDRELEVGQTLRCGRCSHVLKREGRIRSLHPAWAFATTGLILAALANSYPVMTFDVAGNTQSNLIITGVLSLGAQGYWPVAVLVFFCAIAAPVLHLLSVWYVSAACCLGQRWPMVRQIAHASERIEAWSLVPVFAVACVVAVVKLDMLGSVQWDLGIFWIALLSVCTFVVSQTFDRAIVARRLEELG